MVDGLDCTVTLLGQLTLFTPFSLTSIACRQTAITERARGICTSRRRSNCKISSYARFALQPTLPQCAQTTINYYLVQAMMQHWRLAKFAYDTARQLSSPFTLLLPAIWIRSMHSFVYLSAFHYIRAFLKGRVLRVTNRGWFLLSKDINHQDQDVKSLPRRQSLSSNAKIMIDYY